MDFLCFLPFFKRSKGNYQAACTQEEKVEDTMSVEDKYLQMEYFAMAKENEPHDKLTVRDFTRLLMFLRYDSNVNQLLMDHKKNPHDPETYVTCEDYINFMQDPSLKERTSFIRNMFSEFDDNKDCHAFPWQIEKAMEKNYEIELTEEMKEAIAKYDQDKDGKISYEEFLKAQLAQSKYI